MESYFNYINNDILIIILSKINIDDIKVLHTIPELNINLLDLFKYKYPYLSVILHKQYLLLIKDFSIEEYESWDIIFKKFRILKEYSINGISTNDIIPKIIKVLYPIYRIYDKINYRYAYIIINHIFDNEYKQDRYQNIFSKLDKYSIHLNNDELIQFKFCLLLISYDLEFYEKYIKDYINGTNFNVSLFIDMYVNEDNNNNLYLITLSSLLGDYTYGKFERKSLYITPFKLLNKFFKIITYLILQDYIPGIDILNILRNKYEF
jgi:hypothetical protein